MRQDCQSDAMVNADPTQVHQVLMNLYTNAEHAMRQTGGEYAVKLENVELDLNFTRGHQGLKPGAYIKLTVSDTGCECQTMCCRKSLSRFLPPKKRAKGEEWDFR